MKKKFVLTLALVLMVVVGLSAATPLELSGEFSAGRTFRFDPNSIEANSDLELNKLSVAGDFWKVNLDAGTISFGDKANRITGTADIYLSKALAAQGLDMGDLALTLSVGNKINAGLLHVYFDGDEIKGKLEMLGVLPKGTIDLTVGYGEMITGKASLNFDTTNTPFAISAKVAPLDGIAMTAGFTNFAAGETKGGIAGSASVDVAALAGLDFGLSAYLYDSYMLDSKTNMLNVALKASYADVYFTTAMDTKNAFDTFGMFAKVEYKGIENVGMSAKLAFKDLKIDAKPVVSGDVSYTMGGVKYKLAAKYDSAPVLPITSKFSVSPSVTIKF